VKKPKRRGKRDMVQGVIERLSAEDWGVRLSNAIFRLDASAKKARAALEALEQVKADLAQTQAFLVELLSREGLPLEALRPDVRD